jgi:DNA-binding GntR family transcriptional regulator
MDKSPESDPPTGRHIAPLDRQTRLLDTVYDKLCEAIFHSEIAPGSRLSVPLLAARFGVSRSPIKEAVQQLVSDGIAEAIPRRGVFVAQFDYSDLLNLLEIMAPLEAMAGRLAARHRTEADVKALEHIIARLEEASAMGDASVYAKWDSHFHKAIVRMSQNGRLDYFLRILHNQIRLVSRLVFSAPTMVRASLAEHKAIARAIRARDGDLAGRALENHVLRSRERVEKHVVRTAR